MIVTLFDPPCTEKGANPGQVIDEYDVSTLELESSPNKKALINFDQVLEDYVEILETSLGHRIRLQLSKDATCEDVKTAITIIEALRNNESIV